VAPARSGPTARSRAALLLGAAVLAIGSLAVVVARTGSGPYLALGGVDPGTLVRWAAPTMRLLTDTAATVCVGAAVFAVAVAVPRERGHLSPAGYRAVLSAGRWAWCWAACALSLVPLTLATGAGGLAPVARVLAGSGPGALWQALSAGEAPVAWLVEAGLAVAVALGSRVVLHWRSAVGLAVLAVAAELPSLAAGHASSQIDHDLDVSALWWHVPAATIWLGLLLALLRPSWRTLPGAPAPAVLGRRYRRIAALCWLVVVGSGVLGGLDLTGPRGLVTSGYGWSCLAVALAAAAVGVVALTRRWARSPGSRRWLAVEVAILATAMGISAAMTVLVPPRLSGAVDASQTLLGYDLAGPPTAARLALDWRPDVVFVPVAALAALGYVLAVRRVRRSGRGWSAGRTWAWSLGCATVLVATSSGLGRYAAAMFSAHMASHVLLAELAPVLLVLGGPVTLVRAATRPAPAGTPFGPRDWLEAFAGSPWLRRLAHPAVAATLFVAAPFVLYPTGVFDAAARYRWAEVLIDGLLLAIGLLFAQVVVGVDHAADRRPGWLRLGVLLAVMPGGVAFDVLLAHWPVAIGDGAGSSNMYSSLALPWTAGRLLADQRLAAGIALGLGEAAMLLAAGALLWQLDRRRVSAGPAGTGAAAGCSRPRTPRRAPSPPRPPAG
jgi:cytochrome c oxidase assembly factor CtaG/putative copper export protein